MFLNRLLLLAGLAATLAAPACTEKPKEAARLPILGEREVVPRADGSPADTVFAAVPRFRLVDQAGQTLTNQSFAGRAYVADFFFATCPGICPKMQSELLKVYKQYGQDPNVAFLSFTIDPEHDTQPVLADYARRLGVAAPGSTWRFLHTPDRPTAYQLAHNFSAAAQTDLKAPGGIAHSGALALVDDQGYIRGSYDGLNPDQVALLLRQLPILLNEVNGRKATAAR